jgi:hypothetical protein
LRTSFSVFRIKVYRGNVQEVVAAWSLGFNPISTVISQAYGNGMVFEDVVWLGIFESSRSFIGGSSFFFVSGTNMIFLTRLVTFCPQPTTSIRLKEKRQRRRAIDTVWRLKIKGFSRIFL